MKRTVDAETQEIIASFIAEGYERLEDAEKQLATLGATDNTSCLNSVFRLFHSVKGSAGYLGFESIKLLTHEAEALLEVFLKEKAPTTKESIDVVYRTIDSLRAMIELVERENSDEDAAESARSQGAVVRACIDELRGITKTVPTADPPSEKKSKAVNVTTQPRQETPMANEIVLSELVSVEMVDRFLAECSDLVDEVERKSMLLPSLASGSETVNDIFRAVHTIKGNAGFFGFLLLERQCMDLESLLDTARRNKVPINEALVNNIITRVDAIRSAIATVSIVSRQDTGKNAAQNEATNGIIAAGTAAPPDERPLTPAKEVYKPLGEILVDIGAARAEEISEALELQDRPIGEILVETGTVKPEDVAKALSLQKTQAAPVERAQSEEIQRKEIRVDTAKLDKLFELVGELITAEAMVVNSPDLAGLKLDNFMKSFGGLNKISREIQETTMMIRMIPLESLFHKMTRLVRDLSRKFDKPVDFRVSGQETEMDKNVIEQISDPLVHIIRNAIDHGLEDPAARQARGKSPTGVVRLEAKYEGSEIWINVSDDGAGLNRDRILKKAIEKELIKGDPASLSDDDIYKIIFEPGFSTADKVSETSGRGVGMDVVKKNLERIRGRVDIKTQAGNGTEFILKIPLTMAIIDGITLRSGGNYYSIPLGDILEFFKLTPAQITITEQGEETVNLRGSILPLIKLGELFNIAGAVLDPLEGIVIVVQSAGRRACLLIDEVVGNQQIVVKSLSEYLGKVEGISGCSILGDGTVSFIIDTGKLLSIRLEA